MNQFDSFSGQIINTLSTLQDQIDDVSLKQKELAKFITDCQDGSLTEEEYADVKIMMDKTSAYNTKLLSLRTTMVNMSLKSKQLLKRSDKLKATKLDYLSKVEMIRRQEQERDMTIAAKLPDAPVVVQSPSSSSTTTISSPTRISSPSLMMAPTIPVPVPVPVPDSPSSLTSPSSIKVPSPSESSSSLAVAKQKKKKKKPKAREVEIGDDGPAWIPKRTLSSSTSTLKKSIG